MRSRLWALGALQAAVTLSWMAYAYHQPRLLAHFGFETLAGILSWYLAFAGTTLAPLAGDASDRLVRSGGDRFPVVRAGVGLALASFVAVALVARAEGGSAVRFLLPLFVAVWIAGMTVFQAPALAIVRDATGADGLEAATVPLVLATALPAAAWPWVESALGRLGGSGTFLAGGMAIAGTALALGRTVDVGRAASPPRPAVRSGGLAGAFACGLASAIVVLLATDRVPAALAAATPGELAPATLTAIAGAVAALVALPAARLGGRLGSGRALVVGLAVTGLCRVGAGASLGPALACAVAAAAGVGLALHLATALPFALAIGRDERAGLAAGLYVGGVMLGSRLLALA